MEQNSRNSASVGGLHWKCVCVFVAYFPVILLTIYINLINNRLIFGEYNWNVKIESFNYRNDKKIILDNKCNISLKQFVREMLVLLKVERFMCCL